jgi:hypothetical protein
LISCTLVALIGCSTTQQAESAKKSGFLGNYSQLKAGEGDQALLRYRKSNVPWSQYSKVMIDPVSLYAAPKADMKSDSRKEQIALANYFTSSLHENLKKHFTVVKNSVPGALHLRVALTDADQSEVLMDTITTVMPIGPALSTAKRVAASSDTFIGFAQAEMYVLDSQTSARLAAAVDKRYGTKALRSKFGSWNHAQEAVDHWAEQITERLV